MADTTNQSNSQSTQNYEIDIDKVYNDLIKEIDSIRSIVNVTNKDSQDKLNKLSVNNLTSLIELVKVESTPQESRCHAFYRLIGFPVVNSDFSELYNPGFAVVKEGNSLNDEKKVNIANKQIDGFRALSLIRENYPNKATKLFANNANINASVLAASSINFRNFSSPFKSGGDDLFDMDSKNQSYEIIPNIKVGDRDTSFKLYQDENGNFPNEFYTQRFHIIRPFLVDPRIDFTVSPAKNKIAVPFALNKSELMLRDNVFVKRPLLEKIIRDRFGNFDTLNTIGENDKNIIAFIKEKTIIQDEGLIQKVVSDQYGVSDRKKFTEFLNIIEAMISALVDAKQTINTIQQRYYWLPIPTKTVGPEQGSEVKPPILSNSISPELITEKDAAIINLQAKVSLNDLNNEVAQISAKPDLGDFAFDGFKTFDIKASSTSLDQNNLNKLLKKRSHDLSTANDALRRIEIIMGEFSGLGLCDIVAVMGALYTMPRDHLIGFLDEDAKKRLLATSGFSSVPTGAQIQTALKSLSEYVKGFYNLMDKIYKDFDKNNALSE